MTDRDRVSRLTFVPFLHDGRCALIPVGDRLALPSGEVLPGEDPLLDTGLRVPLVTAGFRRQSLHELEAEGDHLYLWCEGDDGYRGSRPHAEVSLWKGEAAEAARRLRAAGDERAAEVVKAVDRARRTLDDERWYRDRLRLPQWADRIWVGNALDWVAPGGRLLVSNYVPAEQRSRYPAAVLASLGFRVDGVTTPGGRDGRPVPPTAWVLRAAEDS